MNANDLARSNGLAATRAAQAGDAETARRLARLATFCAFCALGIYEDNCTPRQAARLDRWFLGEA